MFYSNLLYLGKKYKVIATGDRNYNDKLTTKKKNC